MYKTGLIALLTLLCFAAGGLAWHYHGELNRLRPAIEATEPDRTARLEAKIVRLEAENARLAIALSNASQRYGSSSTAPDVDRSEASNEASNVTPADQRRGAGRGPQRGDFFRGMMDIAGDPNSSDLVLAAQRAQLDRRYADLFRDLNLPPAQLETFKNLLAERQISRMEAASLARSEGASRTDIRDLVDLANEELDRMIRNLLGTEGYEAYNRYEESLPYRGELSALHDRLSYTTAPLQSSQIDQLVAHLRVAEPPRSPSFRATEEQWNQYYRERAAHNQSLVQSAGQVLSADQQAAYAQLLDEQLSQQRLMQTAARRARDAGSGPTRTIESSDGAAAVFQNIPSGGR